MLERSSTSWLEQQNGDRPLTYRAASDVYWCDVQRLRGFQLGLVVLLPVALAVIAQFQPTLVTTADLISFILTVLDASIIYPMITAFRSKAATAQDAFDAVAYSLPNPPVRYLDEDDHSEIYAAARRQNAKRLPRNRDWYSPELGELPVQLGRLACMREAVAWDGGLRWRYVFALAVVLVLAVTAIVVYSVFLKMGITDVVVKLLYPLIPAIVWTAREIWDQWDSARRADLLRKRLDDTWRCALSAGVPLSNLDAIASACQLHIFTYRERTSPVPDAFYRLLRGLHTESARSAARDTVQEYRSSAVHCN